MEKSDMPPPYAEASQPAPYGFALETTSSKGMNPQPTVQPVVAAQPVIIHSPMVVPLGPSSIRTSCPHCKADVNTTTVNDPSMWAYLTAGILCLAGCVFGCCLIPFCIDSCKVTEHTCPNCKRFIGKYSRY